MPTYFICVNHFNGTELTVIYFVNIPFSMQKGRFLSLNPLLNAGGVISVFSKYQFAIILEMEETLKTTFRASSHQSSGLSIAAVYTGLCSIIMRYLRGSALALFMQSYYVSCTANLWNFSSFRGDFLFLQTKELIRTHH